MNSRLLEQMLAAVLLVAANCASAQTASTDIIDSQKPPAGFIAPKPAGARDLSMAKYARESYLAGEEGVVTLRVLVRRDGSVGDAQIAESSGSTRLDQSAHDVVGDWRYRPATVNGAPVDSWVPVNIIWALQALRFEITSDQAKNLPAYYPDASVRLGETGNSTVRFFVGPDGKISTAIIDKSSGHPRLDDAAITMLKTGWHLAPATLATGEVVGAWFRVEIVWTLPGIKPKEVDSCSLQRAYSNPDTAIAACTQFLTDSNLTGYERALAYEARGVGHRSKTEFDEAMADFDRGIHAWPGYSDLYVGRARVHVTKGEMDLAFSDYDSSIQIAPLRSVLYLERGETYLKAGEREQARTDFTKAIEVAPTKEQPDVYKARCFIMAKLADPDSLADCEKSLSLRPKDPFTLGVRGLAYLKLRQYQRAIQDYDAALRINSRLPGTLYGRGVAKLKLGDSKGQADLTAAKAIDPKIADSMGEYGVMP